MIDRGFLMIDDVSDWFTTTSDGPPIIILAKRANVLMETESNVAPISLEFQRTTACAIIGKGSQRNTLSKFYSDPDQLQIHSLLKEPKKRLNERLARWAFFVIPSVYSTWLQQYSKTQEQKKTLDLFSLRLWSTSCQSSTKGSFQPGPQWTSVSWQLSLLKFH